MCFKQVTYTRLYQEGDILVQVILYFYVVPIYIQLRGINLHNFGSDNAFLDLTPKASE